VIYDRTNKVQYVYLLKYIVYEFKNMSITCVFNFRLRMKFLAISFVFTQTVSKLKLRFTYINKCLFVIQFYGKVHTGAAVSAITIFYT